MTHGEKRKLSGVLRRSITDSGLSLSEIARRSGVDKGALSRFMSSKGGLTLESIERLAPTLGIEITTKTK